jgi:hypothetical protein
MKITKRQLKRIIREEKSKLLSEARQGGVGVGFAGWEPNKTADFAKAYGSEARVMRNWSYNPNPIAEIGISQGEREAMRSPEHGLEVPSLPPDVEALALRAEGALNQLITAISLLEDIDPQEAAAMADYAAEEIHSWRS